MLRPAANSDFVVDRPAWSAWVLLLILSQLFVHAISIGAYGYFGDELYWLACSDRLAFGYADQPPASVWLIAVWTRIFGHEIAVLRIPAVLAGTVTLITTCAIAREFGGKSVAQVLAGTAVLVAPGFLIISHYFSGNVFDQAIWTVSFLLLMRVLAEPTAARWLGLGLLLGVGLMNKLSVVCLGVGIAALLLLPQYRRLLATPGPWIAAAAALVVFAPHLGWQVANDWPGIEFVASVTQEKHVATDALRFVMLQFLIMHPLGFLLALLGIGWLWRTRRYAFTIPFLVVAAILYGVGGSKAYYLVGAYPPLLAAGAVAVENLAGHGSQGKTWAPRFAVAVFAAGGLIGLPLCLPILPVEDLISYQRALGFVPPVEDRREVGQLSGHFANMFGWDEVIEATTGAYASLAPAERARSVVLAMDYMDASAIDVLGQSLPPVVSPHNAFAWFDLPPQTAETVIVVGGSASQLGSYFDNLVEVGAVGCEYCIPGRAQRMIFIGRELRMPVAAIRASLARID